VEYMARTAANVPEATSVVSRYLRLLNDALELKVREEGEYVLLMLDSAVPLPRAAADFVSGAFYISSRLSWPAERRPTGHVWFSHAEPANVAEYTKTFEGSSVSFGRPWNGFVVAREFLTLPITDTDPRLHEVVRRYADMMLSVLPRVSTWAERVRSVLIDELSGGEPTAKNIARKLLTSERSLARYLQQEGTTFTNVFEDLRRDLAVRYVRHTTLSFSEIAYLLRFSQDAAFFRAFRRWTGQTPKEYRYRRGASGSSFSE
jgi:AraC-like DNA-binding protein